ncbi:hypothetical protein LPB140_11905 [Sphingorhabdus lutea]|uniref:MarR family transcriptional regulator n=1 Tax=Sphingorhabdus lutea TaxID=1913578 RepID=A0A1L3JE14_9SPHN|nr:hypothetical protein [Sphingorhabdus lutea]APG63374.1 hypothetical protein LPB140_11905 [Sphingorhabdus lutea]
MYYNSQNMHNNMCNIDLIIADIKSRFFSRFRKNPAMSSIHDDDISNMVDEFIQMRNIKNKDFPIGFFSQAYWSILTHAYQAQLNDIFFTMAAAYDYAGVPDNITSRIMSELLTLGFITYDNDPMDQQQHIVRLTDFGVDMIHKYAADAGFALPVRASILHKDTPYMAEPKFRQKMAHPA